MNKKAFSFIEIIISISIITLLSIVIISTKNGYEEKNINTKILSDIETINNAIVSHGEENELLPMPKGNTNFYSVDSSYIHSYSDKDTFGVYGSITENTIAKKYLDITPIDPRTNSYYSYGKTKNYNEFEVASVIFEGGDAKAKVVGNYAGDKGLYSLIREYNGPNFVFENSNINFPYNPYELVLVGKITKLDGTVEIITKNGKSITNIEKIKETVLKKGFKVKVAAGSEAQIHFSDGSTSVIGSSTSESIVDLNNFDFKGESNLSTYINLSVEIGKIWTKATHLNSSSGFEITSGDTTASVRGTIFSFEKEDGFDPRISVKKGQVDIYKNGVFIESLTYLNGGSWIMPEFLTSTNIRSKETIDNINREISMKLNDVSGNDLSNAELDVTLSEDAQLAANKASMSAPIIKKSSATKPVAPVAKTPTVPTTPTPTPKPKPKPTPTKKLYKGSGCGHCPFGYRSVKTSKRCGLFERKWVKYCKGVYSGGSEVMCEKEVSKFISCRKDGLSWSGYAK